MLGLKVVADGFADDGTEILAGLGSCTAITNKLGNRFALQLALNAEVSEEGEEAGGFLEVVYLKIFLGELSMERVS